MRTDLVDEKGNSKPPRQRSQSNGKIPRNGLEDQHAFAYESKTRKQTYEKKDDKRIGKSDSERRDKVMKIRPLAGGYRTNGLYRITAERVDTEYQQQDTSEQLQIENILVACKYRTFL